jgi:hypothetical protein
MPRPAATSSILLSPAPSSRASVWVVLSVAMAAVVGAAAGLPSCLPPATASCANSTNHFSLPFGARGTIATVGADQPDPVQYTNNLACRWSLQALNSTARTVVWFTVLQLAEGDGGECGALPASVALVVGRGPQNAKKPPPPPPPAWHFGIVQTESAVAALARGGFFLHILSHSTRCRGCHIWDGQLDRVESPVDPPPPGFHSSHTTHSDAHHTFCHLMCVLHAGAVGLGARSSSAVEATAPWAPLACWHCQSATVPPAGALPPWHTCLFVLGHGGEKIPNHGRSSNLRAGCVCCVVCPQCAASIWCGCTTGPSQSKPPTAPWSLGYAATKPPPYRTPSSSAQARA